MFFKHCSPETVWLHEYSVFCRLGKDSPNLNVLKNKSELWPFKVQENILNGNLPGHRMEKSSSKYIHTDKTPQVMYCNLPMTSHYILLHNTSLIKIYH